LVHGNETQWGGDYEELNRAFGLGLMVMMVMVVMVMVMMVMVLVMMMVMVPKAHSQVGWLRQRQCQSINRLKPSIGQSFHKLRVQAAQRFLRKRYSCRSLALSRAALKQALKQALRQALKQALK
jgi:biopolymer transport protein ExbB/TolQ